MKKVYLSELKVSSRRRRPVIRWKIRVKEYMHERDGDRRLGNKQAWRNYKGD